MLIYHVAFLLIVLEREKTEYSFLMEILLLLDSILENWKELYAHDHAIWVNDIPWWGNKFREKRKVLDITFIW